MKRRIPSMAILLMALSCFADDSPRLCRGFDGTVASLFLCDGMAVKIHVTRSIGLEQHPNGVIEWQDQKSGLIDRLLQTPVVVSENEPEIVLLTKTKITCGSSLDVDGKVKIISQSGISGTKESYVRPWIEVQRYKCK